MNSRRLFQLDPDSGLSSDLEYLLDSGEAGETELAGALISETYHAGYRLARFFFGETPAAQQALMDAWAAALASAYSYRPGTGACTWFYRLALAVFRRERDQAAYPPAGPPRPANPATPDGVQAGLGPAFEALDEETRLACAMGCALDWPAGDIAAILQEPEGQTRLRLERGRSAARQAPGPEGKPASDPEEALRLGFQARWPAPEPLAPGRLAELAARAAAQARRQMDRSRRRAYLGEIVLVAAAILLAFGLFRGASRFAPEATPTPQPALPPTPTPASPARYAIYPVQPGDSLQSIAERVGMTVDELSRINSIPLGAYRPASRELKITFPGLPDAAPAPGGPEPLLPPLTAASTGEEVRRKLQASAGTWRTLRADYQLLSYGPQDTVGPPRVTRGQVWVRQPDLGVTTAGLLQGGVQQILYEAAGRSYLSSGSAEVYFNVLPQRLSPGLYSDPPSGVGTMVFPALAPWAKEPGAFHVTGSEPFSGQVALIADWMDGEGRRLARLWLDARTGVVLRLQSFAAEAPDLILTDLAITRIAYNPNIPLATFDPLAGSLPGLGVAGSGSPGSPQAYPTPFGGEALAGRPHLAPVPPPEGFDPGGEPLVFQFPASLTSEQLQSGSRMAGVQAEVFAGGYSLGKIEFPSSWDVICSRSPDGERIAYNNYQASNQVVFWVDLKDTGKLHWAAISSTPVELAFAPDSRRVAVFGRKNSDQQGDSAIYILDTGTGQVETLIQLSNARSLVWKPGGTELAFIGLFPGGDGEMAQVFDLSAGHVVDSQPLDALGNLIGTRSIQKDWGVKFPIASDKTLACPKPN